MPTNSDEKKLPAALIENQLLRERHVIEVYPVSPRQLRREVQLGIFPRPIRVRGRIKMWRAADVLAFLASPPEAEKIAPMPPQRARRAAEPRGNTVKLPGGKRAPRRSARAGA